MQAISEFRVKDKAGLNELLDAAVETAQVEASTGGTHGILVTRHDFGHYSVALSLNVPFGLIRENDQARPN
jgi:hypothetical protein